MNLTEISHFVLSCWFINTGLNTFKFIPGIKKIDRPLDGEALFFDKKRILGPSTTLLGFPFALLYGLLSGAFFYTYSIGLFLGAAAYFGHALGSFIKRRLNVRPGGFLPFVDHGDFIIIGGLVLMYLQVISFKTVVISVLLTWIFQPLLCYIGYKLKLRENPL